MIEPNKMKKKVLAYFSGVAELKFRSDYYQSASEKSTFDIFKIDAFYEIKVKDIQTISKEEFHKIERKLNSFNFKEKADVIQGIHQNGNFRLDAENLISPKQPVPHFSQVEEGTIHGYFKNIFVVFSHYREIEVCKPNYPTGRTRIINDIEELEFQNEDCSTYWSSVEKETEQETQGDPEITKPKDRKADEKISGESQPAGKSTNCKKRLEKVLNTPDYLGTFLLILLIVLGILFLPLLALGILQYLFAALFINLLYLFGYFIYLLFETRIGLFILYIIKGFITVAFLILLIMGISNFFSLSSKNGIKPEKMEQTINHDENQISPPIPVKTNEQDDTLTPVKDSLIHIYRKWKGLDKKIYEGKYSISMLKLRASTSKLESLIYSARSFNAIYQSLFLQDKNHLSGVYNMLDSIKRENSQNKYQFLQTVVSMVQSLEYSLVLENSCDPNDYQNRQIRSLFNQSKLCIGQSPFGLRTPLEFLTDLKGDCDTRTLLLYTILKHYNFEVAIINSDFYQHSMLGINLPGLVGAYKNHYGQKYYFWETTDQGFKPGYLASEFGNTNYWKIILN
jgi:hypothetical protein